MPAGRLLAAALIPLVVGCANPYDEGSLPSEGAENDASRIVAEPEPPADAVALPPAEVDTLFVSNNSGIVEPAQLVVESEAAWSDAWGRLTRTTMPSSAEPEVDFSARRVIVLAMGTRPTGGYAVEVVGLSLADDVLYVSVRYVSPGPSCLTTQAVTEPAIALGVPSSWTTVEFLEDEVVFDCGGG